MTNTLNTDIRIVRPGMENHDSQDDTQPPQDTIQDVYVLIVREQEADHTHIVDSTTAVPTQPALATKQPDSFISTYVFVCCSLFLIISTLTFQLSCILNPPISSV